MSQTAVYNEKALLLQVSEGNEQAFRQLYLQWQPYLASFVYRITKSKELAAETVQDVFLKIWMGKERLGKVDDFKSYLYTVSRNQSINALYKVMREMKRFQQWENTVKEETETHAEESKLIKLSLVDEAIDHLPPRQKEVYLLHRHERLTYEQIAEKLGIGRESVKTHLGLAVKSITKFLRERLSVTALLIGTISKYL